jgi:hypothetical protein
MTWLTELHIKNETKSTIVVKLNNNQPAGIIAPHNELLWSWTSQNTNDAFTLDFVEDASVKPPVVVMQSSITFADGVYIDRGDLPEQTISLIGNVNSTNYSQTTNGGQTIVPASEFTEGGTVNMIYSDIV